MNPVLKTRLEILSCLCLFVVLVLLGYSVATLLVAVGLLGFVGSRMMESFK